MAKTMAALVETVRQAAYRKRHDVLLRSLRRTDGSERATRSRLIRLSVKKWRKGKMRQANNGQEEYKVGKGLAAGLIGGLAASFAMNQFQTLWNQLAQAEPSNGQSGQQNKRQTGARQVSSTSQEQEPATVKTAEVIAEGVFDHHLNKSEKQMAGPAVHYTFGTTVGGVYGVLAEIAPPVTIGAGLPFATVLWLLADEAAVPALGLSKPPSEYPPSMHSYALASHLVYGLTVEGVRRIVRQAL
jgi:putative membrane protein